MKNSILLFTACICSTLSLGQENLEGEWKFKKMMFYDREVTFDNSENDKEKVLLSWMELGGDDILDFELKKQYSEEKEEIYRVAKSLLGSNIAFENCWDATCNYKSFEETDDGVLQTTRSVELEDSNKKYIIMNITRSNPFGKTTDKFKLILKEKTLEIINLESAWEDEGSTKITFERK